MKRRTFISQSAAAALVTSASPLPFLSGSTWNSEGSKPRICIFSKHLQWLGYAEMAALAGRIGFTGIDLTVRPGGHVLPERVEDDLPEAVRLIREEGLEVPMITTAITDPGDPLTTKILETAGGLGIGIYRTGWFRYREGEAVRAQLEHARRQLRGLQVINASCGIAASYQNHAGDYIGSSGWDLLEIIEGLDPRWTGVQFDVRHAMVEGFETWPFVLELLAPFINSLDIKDYTWNTGEGPRVLDVPLGQGLVPFPAYLERLEKLRIRADFSIHCEYDLGGAENGASALSITGEEFEVRVRTDLEYFKALLEQRNVTD
jgi:sugar phosphate isomerase/epimerase